MQVLRRTAWIALLLVGSLAQAGSGVVQDEQGNPLGDGVKVCLYNEASGSESFCVETDEQGRYEILEGEVDTVRVLAPGFFPETVPVDGHQLVTLRRSPSLLAFAEDAATGEPIDRCEIWVVYPTAKKKGPFPTTPRGVLIRRILEPGKVRVFGRAEGYEDSPPVEIELEPGKEAEATVKLRRKSDG